MAAAHFDMLPVLALQVAGRMESYCVAIRTLAANPQRVRSLDVASAAVREITEMSRQVPAIWSEWGSFVAAHAEFALLAVMQPGSPRFEPKLLAVDTAAEGLMAQAVRWALLEQHQAPVALEVAQAFIEWQSARKVYFEIRRGERHIGRQAAHADPGMRAARDHLHAIWESKCAALLSHAQRLLEQVE